MNRTFKIIKNALGQYVVAGELAKTKGKAKSLTHLLLLSTLVPFSLSSQASLVRGDVDYQEFRNFAENKGKYQPEAVNIPVHDNNGNSLGTVLPQDVPMPDFSATNFGTGVATLVNLPSAIVNSNQFIASVAHNTNERLNNLSFGGRSYQVASYNRASTYWQDVPEEDYFYGIRNNYDFALPRLSKMVTAVMGTEVPHLWGGLNNNVIPSEYTAFARLGSGTQEVWNHTTDTNDRKMGAYVYLTGGTPISPINGYDYDTADIENPSTQQGKYIVAEGNLFSLLTNENRASGPLMTHTLKGDSGSPLYAYNSSTGRWVLFALTQGGKGCTTEHCSTRNSDVSDRWTVIDSEFINKVTTEKESHRPVLLTNLGGSNYHWYSNPYSEAGLSYLTTERGYYGDFVGGTPLKITDDSRYSDADKGAAAIDNGQDLYLSDGLTVNLEQPIDQGAGGIYLTYGEANVTATNDYNTWVGSGVYVGENARLNWRVKQPEIARKLEGGNADECNNENLCVRDILSKLGSGTLNVNGNGINHGGISVGDGEVILNQQADYRGEQQAFSSVELTSGRGTVTLMDDNQVKDNNFSFGYRGGKLDLNGHDLTLIGLRNYDDGGNIVNHNQTKETTLILKPYVFNVIEYYDNFKGFLGAKSDATKPNGELNVEIQKTVNGTRERKAYYLTGGANLNGSLTANGTTVTLQGKNNPYADIITQDPNGIAGSIVSSVTNSADWVNRDYRVKNLSVIQQGTVNIGRNVTELSAETVSVKDSSTLNLGFKKDSNFRIFDDGQRVKWSSSITDLSPDFYHLLPTTQAVANEVNLANNSALNIHKATLTSRILGDQTSTTTLWADSTWNMNGDSYVQQLMQKAGSALSATAGKLTATINAEKGSSTTLGTGTVWTLLGDSTVDQLTLNNAGVRLNPQSEYSRFNILNVLGKLSGTGVFHFNTDLAGLQGNKVKVKDVEGAHTIAVQDSGREVSRATPEKLALFEISGDSNKATFNLQNGHVDAGAFRYTLSHLVNKVAELSDLKFEEEARLKAEEAERQRLEEEKRKAEEEAERQRLEEEKRKAEEAERQRLEEEKRKAEEAERQRLEEEKRKAEEAERQRLEEEKRKAEEAERQHLEEEKRKAEEAERQRLEEEKRKAEEAERQRLEEEKRKAEEAERQRLEEEKRKAEEAERQRLEEEKRKAEEAERQRLEEEKRKAEEAERQRLEEEKRKAEEAERQRLEEEKRKAEEAERQRLEEEKRKAEEAERQRLEEEKRKAEEAERQRLEEEKRKAEEAERQRLEEEKRKAEEAERQRLEEKRKAEEAERQRLEEEKRKAEEAERQRLEEEKRKAEEEAERQRLEEEKRKAEEAERQRLEEKRKAEEAERQRLEEEKRKAEEEARLKAEEETRLKAEEEARLKAEEEARLKAEEEARLKAEEEARLKAEEARLKAEEEARLKAEEEARLKAEEEARLKAEEEARLKAEEEARLKAEEEARLKAEEEARLKAEEEARLKAEEEARLKAEEEARLKAEEARLKAEEEARLKAEEEARLKAEEEARLKAEEEARLKAEEEARLKAEEEARLKAEEEARLKAEEEARLKAEEEARLKAEEEARLKAEEEARLKAEEAKRNAEKPQKEIISKYTNAAISDAVISVQTILNATKDVKQHLAQTQLNEVGQVNVWSRINSGKNHYDSEYYRSFESRQTQTQLGVDTLVTKGLQVGAVMTQTRNTNSFADAISDKNKLLFGSVYAKYQWNNGVFAALDVGAGKLESEISLGKVKFHRNVTQAGLSVGKAFNFDALEIKPTVGISRSYLSSSNYELDQAQINVDETQITLLSAGLDLGYNMTFGDFSVKPTLSAYYVKNNGDSQVKVNGYSFNYEIEEQQHYNAGIALKYKQVSLELNGGVTKGSQSGKQHSAGAKISWTF